MGGALADILMPNHDWQRYRDAGKTPIARGLAPKEGIQEFLETYHYSTAANELAMTNNIVVVVLETNSALVLDVNFDVE